MSNGDVRLTSNCARWRGAKSRWGTSEQRPQLGRPNWGSTQLGFPNWGGFLNRKSFL